MSQLVKYTTDQFKGVTIRMEELGMKREQIKREISFALQLINKNKYLMQCSKDSILSAVLNIANIDLTLNPASRKAYLIPYKGSAKLEISYIGLVDLMIRHGGIKSIIANVVREGDEFRYVPTDSLQPVVHSPGWDSSARILGVYAVATLPDGTKQADRMTLAELYKVRESSESYQYAVKNKKSCIWMDHESEMMKKTIVRRIFKLLPKGSGRKAQYIDNAIEIENRDYGASLGQKMHIETLLMSANISPEQREDLESRIDSCTNSEANSIIEFLKSVQISDFDRLGTGSQKQIGDAVSNAVNRENT